MLCCHKTSYVALFKRAAKRPGSVPLFSVAAEIGRVVSDSQEATLAIAMFARYGECGIRQLRDTLQGVPVMPTAQESTKGPVIDVLFVHPCLVDYWTAGKRYKRNPSEGGGGQLWYEACATV